jgi:protein phosphatase-4 regulatory subunit 3
VVPIKDPAILTKVHETYRLQYLKDVVLARIIDDATFSMLNSFIFFHQVDVVNHLQADEAYLTALFAIFEDGTATAEAEEEGLIGPTLPSAAKDQATTPTDQLDKQHQAILLLQQFCALAKNLQLGPRNAFYRQMGQRGLLRVLERALTRTTPSQQLASADKSEETRQAEEEMRIATIDILMMVIDHNPAGVRAYCLSKASEEEDDSKRGTPSSRSLVLFLIDLLLHETDLGIQAQMAEAIKVLVSTVGEPIAPGIAEVRMPEAIQFGLNECVWKCTGRTSKERRPGSGKVLAVLLRGLHHRPLQAHHRPA